MVWDEALRLLASLARMMDSLWSSVEGGTRLCGVVDGRNRVGMKRVGLEEGLGMGRLGLGGWWVGTKRVGFGVEGKGEIGGGDEEGEIGGWG